MLFIFRRLKYKIILFLFFGGFFFAGILIMGSFLMLSDTSEEEKDFYDITGGRLSDETLSFQEDVEAELENQGIDKSWKLIVLGIIQAESGGRANSTPDIMQSSESKGLAPNSITCPIESISAGISALSSSILKAEELGITDKKAILQGYNFGNAFLSAMNNENHDTWTIDFAESYSKNTVFPAVTGKSSSEAYTVEYDTPWSRQVDMTYRWYNGGNFHYPNIIYFYAQGAVTDREFVGKFSSPYSNYVITSEYGYRKHPIHGDSRFHQGLDLVSQGSKSIEAVAGGTVVENTFNQSRGWYIVIDHGEINGKKYYSLYAHMESRSSCQVNTEVSQGQIIGTEGTTGESTGSHLHLEIIETIKVGDWIGADRIDPRSVIPLF